MYEHLLNQPPPNFQVITDPKELKALGLPVSRRPYDLKKKLVYDAEEVFEASEFGNGREFSTISEAAHYITKVHSLDPLFRDKPFIAVRRAHGNSSRSWADYEENCISLVEEQMNEQIILHELAHLATDEAGPFHGPDFYWNYLDLTLRWRGPQAYVVLRDAMRDTGVFE